VEKVAQNVGFFCNFQKTSLKWYTITLEILENRYMCDALIHAGQSNWPRSDDVTII
jgi:hypothetical protein